MILCQFCLQFWLLDNYVSKKIGYISSCLFTFSSVCLPFQLIICLHFTSIFVYIFSSLFTFSAVCLPFQLIICLHFDSIFVFIFTCLISLSVAFLQFQLFFCISSNLFVYIYKFYQIFQFLFTSIQVLLAFIVSTKFVCVFSTQKYVLHFLAKKQKLHAIWSWIQIILWIEWWWLHPWMTLCSEPLAGFSQCCLGSYHHVSQPTNVTEWGRNVGRHTNDQQTLICRTLGRQKAGHYS